MSNTRFKQLSTQLHGAICKCLSTALMGSLPMHHIRTKEIYNILLTLLASLYCKLNHVNIEFISIFHLLKYYKNGSKDLLLYHVNNDIVK